MSSTLYDFSLINKPVFLFFPDLENYSNNERGLYLNIKDLPYPCSTTFEDLIVDIEKFDIDKYNKKVKKFIQSLGYVEEQKTSEIVAKFILEEGYKNE